MTSSREDKAIKNIVFSVGYQVVNVLCGLIVPHVLLKTFGSEIYGATSSITHFLAYISLLEGGVGGVARSALYKPLATNDIQTISNVLYEIKKFFRIIACVFVAYVLFIACFFNQIANFQSMDRISTFFLVIAISISTFAQYFIGISNNTLLYASQRTYVVNSVNIITTALNTVMVLILCNMGFNVIWVKLVSSCVFALRPLASWMLVKKYFTILNVSDKHTNALSQKWTGLGQHLAYFLHSNTDVVVLTIFGNLNLVAVYSVYHMVVSSIENFTGSCLTGMESLCGEMIAREENDNLKKTFSYYQTFMSVIISILFSCTISLIMPFVELYTKGVNDANYIEPLFGLILICASIVYCVRIPYHAIVIAAGHFKETKYAAYGETAINLLLSIILVRRYGLVGVAVGTLAAVFYRLIYYVVHLSRCVLKFKVIIFIKRTVIDLLILVICSSIGYIITLQFDIKNYLMWAVVGVLVLIETVIITGIVNYLFYKEESVAVIKKITSKFLRKNMRKI